MIFSIPRTGFRHVEKHYKTNRKLTISGSTFAPWAAPRRRRRLERRPRRGPEWSIVVPQRPESAKNEFVFLWTFCFSLDVRRKKVPY